jgi:UDP-N-acetylmuramoyl-tripeptide--D-alanyl-D-alanine ligase
VGTAHIEHLGSRKAIAIEKGTVARVLSDRGTLLLPSDCDDLYDFRASTPARVITVGGGEIRAENTVSGESGSAFDLTIDGLGTKRTSISVVGRHMISNALLAAGAGFVLGLDLDEISAGLTKATLTSGRLRRYLSHGLTVIDDTYNANPESVTAALETLASLPGDGRKIAALGMMGELGEHALKAYPRIGGIARDLGVTLVTVGDDANKYGADHHFKTHEEAATCLSNETSPGDIVLFKGSRMAAMDRVMKLTFPE